jgi:hypothetical protein
MDITKVKDAFRLYAKALTNWLYTRQKFQRTPRRMRDGAFVECEKINAYTLVVENLKETVHLEDTLRLILERK